tara:strand:+ start:1086 stop:1667 length:582 start_codon:yes stop_codon:yes gene_type:complete
MAFKQKGYPMQKGTASYKKASSTPMQKTYKEAYADRDQKIYGGLNEADYIAEAKRQNKSKKETGKWDAPKEAMTSEAPKPKVKTKTSTTTVLPDTKAERTRDVTKTKGEDGSKTKKVVVTDSSDKVVKTKTKTKDADGNRTKVVTKSDSTRKTNRKSFQAAKEKHRDAVQAWRKGGKEGEKPTRPNRSDYMNA